MADEDNIDILEDWGPAVPSVQPRQFVERRRKTDWVVRSVTIIAALGWISALLALLFMQRVSSSPWGVQITFPDQLGEPVSGSWNSSMVRLAFFATLFSFAASLVGFVLNAARHRRKTDRYNKLLIGIGAASIVIFVVFLVSYSKHLYL